MSCQVQEETETTKGGVTMSRLQHKKVGHRDAIDSLTLTKEEKQRLNINLKALEARIARRCKVTKCIKNKRR